jgi:hypothetical protein
MLVVISVGVWLQSKVPKRSTGLTLKGIFQVEIKTGTVVYSFRGTEPFTVTFYKM